MVWHSSAKFATDGHGAPRPWIAWVALLLLALLYLTRLGGHPLQDPDEGRYAEIPREMIESGDFVTPRLNYVKYFEKPPLLYWLVAASFQTLGESEGSARVVPALAAIGAVWLTYLLGVWLISRRGALIGATVLATSPLFFALSQGLVIDMLLTTAMTATLVAFYRAQRAEAKTAWVLATALASALAVLAKGPIGLVLPGAIALTFLIVKRDGTTFRALLGWRPIGAFALVVLPWFVLVSVRNPEFLHFFFVHEHLQRFASDVGHPEGAWYYIPVILLGGLPWTATAAGLLSSRDARGAFCDAPADARLFLGLWAGIVVAFFTVASSKLPAYVLPAFPPLALLAGAWVDAMFESPVLSRALRRTAAALLILAVGYLGVSLVGQMAPGGISERLGVDLGDVTAIAVALGWSGAVLVLVALCRELLDRVAPRSVGITSVAVALSVALSLWAAIGGRHVTRTSRELAHAAVPHLQSGTQLVSYRGFMQGLSFYTRQRIVQIDTRGEIWHGAQYSPGEAEFFWSNLEELTKAWADRPLVIATSRRNVGVLQSTLAPTPQILAQDGDRYLLGRPAPDGLVRSPTP